jgi:hypothetical protein
MVMQQFSDWRQRYRMEKKKKVLEKKGEEET